MSNGDAPVVVTMEILVNAPVVLVWALRTDVSGWLSWRGDIDSGQLTEPVRGGLDRLTIDDVSDAGGEVHTVVSDTRSASDKPQRRPAPLCSPPRPATMPTSS